MAGWNRSSYASLIWFTLIVCAYPAYSLYLDIAGFLIPGQIDFKRESIDIRQGDWSRSLSVSARYQPAGERMPSHTEAQVDAETFDRLRIGSPVMVKYLPSPTLRQIPIKLARIADQPTYSIRPDRYPTLAVLSGIAVLVLIWRIAHLNLAGWLLIPYLAFVFCYLLMPSATPAPSGPRRTSRATVNQLKEVTQILETDESDGVDAIQPYEIVELRFVPEGRTESVSAVDQIDSGSVPGLAKGATVEIEYQAGNPRLVRIKGGSRTFPEKAYLAVAQQGGVYIALLAILAGIAYLFRTAGKRFLSGLAATIEESLQRRLR